MKIRIASDIHTEFMARDLHKIDRITNTLILPCMEDDKQTVLILAGDIGSAYKPDILVKFLEVVCSRFLSVHYISGNHEFYGGCLGITESMIADKTKHLSNLVFGNGKYSPTGLPDIHQYTLWTDFCNGDNYSMQMASYTMNDYRVCFGEYEGVKMTPVETLIRHKQYIQQLEAHLKEGDIVVTHHLPSYKSIDARFKSSNVNSAYASDLDALILEKKPKLWIHGHTHASNDYMLGNTRVISNPRGYTIDLNPDYNSKLLVEI